MSQQRATDALANERTFLAYIRTALAFVAFGFVIARFSLFVREVSQVAHIHLKHGETSFAFGAAMALAGVVLALFGAWRYVSANRALCEGRTESLAPALAYVIGAATAVCGIIVGITILSYR